MNKIFLAGCIVLIGFPLHAQVNVDLLTGKLQARIPLFEVTQGSLSVPVTLDYDGGGVRVEQEEGSAGMSWDVNAGGAVVRELRGLPDDFSESTGLSRKGWLASGIANAIQSKTFLTDATLTNCDDENTDYDFLAAKTYQDCEPDVFTFYAPGLSGRFVFDASGNPKLLSYQDIKIQVIKNGSGVITSFKIRNNQGTLYQFSAMESLTRKAVRTGATVSYFALGHDQFQEPLTFTTSWRLTTIRSANNDRINFSYQALETINMQTDISTISETGSETKQYDVYEDIDLKQLTTISSPRQTVTFEWNDRRVTGLAETRIGSSQARSFTLQYAFVYDAAEANPLTLIKKAFLMKLTENFDCVPYPSYDFDYQNFSGQGLDSYAVPLAFSKRKKQDLWGYFSGGFDNATLVPPIYIKPLESDGERYRAVPLASESPDLTGTSRLPQLNIPANGSLISIQYPEGGYTDITYKNNDYYDAKAGATKLGGGVRVYSISTTGVGRGSEDITTYYKYLNAAGTQSSGKLSYPPSYAFPDGNNVIRTTRHMGPPSYVTYERVSVEQTGKGETVSTYLLPAMYPSISEATLWGATKNKVARDKPGASCISLGNLVSGYYSFPWAPSQNIDYAQGLLSLVTEYDESGAKVSEKEYVYEDFSIGAASLNGVKYERMGSDKVVFGNYAFILNKGKRVSAEKVRVTDEVTPGPDPANPTNFVETITSYSYSSTTGMLTNVDVTNSDGVVNSTKYKYTKDFLTLITNPEPTDTAAFAIKALNDSSRYAIPVHVTNYVGPDVTRSSLTIFREYQNGTRIIFPYKVLSFLSKSGYTDPTVTTNGSGKHVFNYNQSDYIGTKIISYVDGVPTATKDHRNKKSGVHYGYSGTTPTVPIAAFEGALAQECAYENFESATANKDFAFTPNYATGGGLAGGAGAWAAADYRRRDGIQKGSSRYKASAWVKAAAATNVTFKIIGDATGPNPFLVDQKVISYVTADANKWKYIEALLDVSTAPSTFMFQVHSSAAATFDEILLHPVGTNVKTMTYDGRFRKVAEFDETGNAMYTTYDETGRPTVILNKNKDIVQFNEYKLDRQAVVPANSSFRASLAEEDIRISVPVTFTNATNCGTVASRQWKVGDTDAGTGASLVYTPPAIGPVTVSLVVTLTDGSFSKSEQTFCVSAPALSFTINVENDSYSGNHLDDDEVADCYYGKTFTAVLSNNGCGGPITYTWQYQSNEDGIWHTATDGDSNDQVLEWATELASGYDYIMKCTITQECPPGSYPCKPYNNVAEDTQGISWVNGLDHCP